VYPRTGRESIRWPKIIREVLELLKNKPCFRDELVKHLKEKGTIKESRSRAFEDVIKSLKDCGIIEQRDDGRYYLSIFEKYGSEIEYNVKLRHSAVLLGLNPEKLEFPDVDFEPYLENLLKNEFFLQHLQSGYPDIYNIIASLDECKQDIVRKKELFHRTLANEIGERRVQMPHWILKERVISTLEL